MLIQGKDLNQTQKRQVLAAFCNIHWAVGDGKRYATTEQWLADHAFHFVKDGSRLSKQHKFCEPFYFAV